MSGTQGGAKIATSHKGTDLNRQAFGTCLPQPGSSDRSNGWLNDEIITAYLEHVVAYAEGQTTDSPRPKTARGATPKVVAFTSFFWSRFLEAGWKGVERWPKRMGIEGKKLLEAELVFVPINSGMHWTLLVIKPKERCMQYYDSLYTTGAPIMNKAREWLQGQLGDDYDDDEWIARIAASPKQTNTSDCGVFTITTAKMIMLGWDPYYAYGAAEIPVQRQRILAELMNGGFHGDFPPFDRVMD